MKSVSKEVADRITRSKYIFIHGAELLDRQAPEKEGLALLAFHDSLEMMLRAIAEHFHVSLKASEPFDSLLNKLEKGAGCQMTHRSALLQLNKARVGFKHHGLLPQAKDVEKFRKNQEEFFSNLLRDALGLEFWALSLADLVEHRRARNWLKKAEALFSEGQFSEAIDCAAASLAMFRKTEGGSFRKRDLERKIRGWRDGSRDGGQLSRGLTKLARLVDERVTELEERLDWVASGASFEGLQRFLDLTPVVQVSGSGKLHFHHASSIPTVEESLFCVAFVTETLIRQQNQYRRDPFRALMAKRTCRVIEDTPIVLFLEEGEVEKIRMANRGEELDLYPSRLNHDGYTAILQDGTAAFVNSAAIEEVE